LLIIQNGNEKLNLARDPAESVIKKKTFCFPKSSINQSETRAVASFSSNFAYPQNQIAARQLTTADWWSAKLQITHKCYPSLEFGR